MIATLSFGSRTREHLHNFREKSLDNDIDDEGVWQGLINKLYRGLRSLVLPTSQVAAGWQQVKPRIIWKLTQFRNPSGELRYQNETIHSLSSKSLQQPEDLAQLPPEHSENSPQNSRSVRRRTSSKPNARRKAKNGTLSGTQESRSGQGKRNPSTTNCLGYIQQIQTLQAENASLQKRLRGVKREFKCPLCPYKYSRTDLLNRHIRRSLDYRHQYIAAKIKQTWCLICNKKFTRPEEVVKHERKCHEISQSRAELAFALSPSLIASNQPDTSIHPTNEAQVPNALELGNAASSANLEPASSISSLNIRTISNSSARQRRLSNFSNSLEYPNSPSNGLSNELDDLLSRVAGQDSASNGLSNRFCSWPVGHAGLPDGIAGQSNSGNGLSNELDDFLNHIAGQDSFSNGLFNGFCSLPVEPGGLPDGIAGQSNSSNGLSNELDDFLNHIAGQDSFSNGLFNGFCSLPVEPGGLPDGIAGQSNPSNGFSNELDDFLNYVAGQGSSSNGLPHRFCIWPAEHGGLLDGIGQSNRNNRFSGWLGEHGGLLDGVAGQNSPGNGLSNGLGGLFF
jgi:hypothetical protein